MRQAVPENLQKAKPRTAWCKVFRKLCRLVRIETKLVRGIIRGRSYLPGEDLEKHRGCWVSVLVNQSWWTTDPVVVKDKGDAFIHNSTVIQQDPLSEFEVMLNMKDYQQYMLTDFEGFLKDPEELIFFYFPDADYWQLLARQVSKHEFTEMAVLGDGFFKLGIKLLNQEKTIILVEAESVLISLGFPEKARRQFMYSLHYCNNGSLDSDIITIKEQTFFLKQFVILETIMEKGQVNMRVQFPHTGSSFLSIFGNEESAPATLHICSYRLVYSNPKCSNPFPSNNRQEWGPGIDALKLGLIPFSHKSGEIIVDKKVIQVAFRDTRRLQFKYDLSQDGKVVDSGGIKLSFLRNNEDIVFVIDVEPEVTGLFALNLYARQRANQSFKNFCTYLVRKIEFRSEIPTDVKNIEKKVMTHLYNYRHEESMECEPTEAPDNGRLHLTVDTAEVSKPLVELKLQDKQELNFSEHTRHWIKITSVILI